MSILVESKYRCADIISRVEPTSKYHGLSWFDLNDQTYKFWDDHQQRWISEHEFTIYITCKQGEGLFKYQRLTGNDSYTVLLIHSDTYDGSTQFIDCSKGGIDQPVISPRGDVRHSTMDKVFGNTSIYFDSYCNDFDTVFLLYSDHTHGDINFCDCGLNRDYNRTFTPYGTTQHYVEENIFETSVIYFSKDDDSYLISDDGIDDITINDDRTISLWFKAINVTPNDSLGYTRTKIEIDTINNVAYQYKYKDCVRNLIDVGYEYATIDVQFSDDGDFQIVDLSAYYAIVLVASYRDIYTCPAPNGVPDGNWVEYGSDYVFEVHFVVKVFDNVANAYKIYDEYVEVNSVDDWNHFAVTYTEEGKIFNLYLNGRNVKSFNLTPFEITNYDIGDYNSIRLGKLMSYNDVNFGSFDLYMQMVRICTSDRYLGQSFRPPVSRIRPFSPTCQIATETFPSSLSVYSLDFDSSNIPELGVNGFTIDLWLKPLFIGSDTRNTIVAFYDVDEQFICEIGIDSEYRLYLYYPALGYVELVSDVIFYNQWSHIAIQYFSSKIEIYVDGVKYYSNPIPFQIVPYTITFGATLDNKYPCLCLMDEIRYSLGQRYTDSFIVPITPYGPDDYPNCDQYDFSIANYEPPAETVLLVGSVDYYSWSRYTPPATSYVVNKIDMAHASHINRVDHSLSNGIVHPRSLYFDGSSSIYFTGNYVYRFDTSGHSFYLGFWCYIEESENNIQYLFDYGRDEDIYQIRIFIEDGYLKVSVQDAYSNKILLTSENVIPLNSWHYINVFCRNNVIYLYIDGYLNDNQILSHSLYPCGDFWSLYIGSSIGGQFFFKGYMDDIILMIGDSDSIWQGGYVPKFPIMFRSRLVRMSYFVAGSGSPTAYVVYRDMKTSGLSYYGCGYHIIPGYVCSPYFDPDLPYQGIPCAILLSYIIACRDSDVYGRTFMTKGGRVVLERMSGSYSVGYQEVSSGLSSNGVIGSSGGLFSFSSAYSLKFVDIIRADDGYYYILGNEEGHGTDGTNIILLKMTSSLRIVKCIKMSSGDFDYGNRMCIVDDKIYIAGKRVFKHGGDVKSRAILLVVNKDTFTFDADPIIYGCDGQAEFTSIVYDELQDRLFLGGYVTCSDVKGIGAIDGLLVCIDRSTLDVSTDIYGELMSCVIGTEYWDYVQDLMILGEKLYVVGYSGDEDGLSDGFICRFSTKSFRDIMFYMHCDIDGLEVRFRRMSYTGQIVCSYSTSSSIHGYSFRVNVLAEIRDADRFITTALMRIFEVLPDVHVSSSISLYGKVYMMNFGPRPDFRREYPTYLKENFEMIISVYNLSRATVLHRGCESNPYPSHRILNLDV